MKLIYKSAFDTQIKLVMCKKPRRNEVENEQYCKIEHSAIQSNLSASTYHFSNYEEIKNQPDETADRCKFKNDRSAGSGRTDSYVHF